jgi:signal transduction protein with GAF and PtsI domain
MAGSGSGAGSRGEPFGVAGATATTTTARTALSTAAPPAETDESEGSRERLARDVMKLRESIDAIRRTLDRALSGASEEAGVIDIRDRS